MESLNFDKNIKGVVYRWCGGREGNTLLIKGREEKEGFEKKKKNTQIICDYQFILATEKRYQKINTFEMQVIHARLHISLILENVG